MMDPGELCGILQCCRDDDDGSDNSNDISILIGLVMFVVSECLPFVQGVKANGLLHLIMNFT